MIYLTFTLLLFISAVISSHFHHQLQRRDVTTVYQPITIYETVVANAIEGVHRKTRKIYKHRHEVIKQHRQEFEDELKQLNQHLDPYREYTAGQAAKYRQESNHEKNDTSANYSYGDEEDDEWCCEEGEEGCDENEYEECNEGEEGCEEYDPDEELILREVDFDIYIVDIDEYVDTTVHSVGEAAFTLPNGPTVNGIELATIL